MKALRYISFWSKFKSLLPKGITTQCSHMSYMYCLYMPQLAIDTEPCYKENTYTHTYTHTKKKRVNSQKPRCSQGCFSTGVTHTEQ